MNEITQKILRESCIAHPKAARRNDAIFEKIVEHEHFSYMKEQYYAGIFYKALRRWKTFHPEHFEDGFPRALDPEVAAAMARLQKISERILRNRIDKNPEMRLHPWKESYITAIVGRQLTLLKEK